MNFETVKQLAIGTVGYWGLWFVARPVLTDHISDEIAVSFFVLVAVTASHFKLTDAIGSLKKRVDSLVERVDNLALRLSKLDGKQEELKGKSPISLTEKGLALSKAADGKRLAEKYKSKIKLSVSASNYEVQETCLAFAEFDFRDTLEEQEKTDLENLAYQRGISIERVLRVIGIEMRDLILAERENNETSAGA
jgi:hypothetical protein